MPRSMTAQNWRYPNHLRTNSDLSGHIRAARYFDLERDPRYEMIARNMLE